MDFMKMALDGEKLKLSKYAFFIERDGGDVIIYSSLSGLILHCYDEEHVGKAKAIMHSEDLVFDKQNDLLCTLYEHKVLQRADFDEELWLRSMYENGILKAKDLKLMLIVTRNCNFDCAYCGQKHENMVMQPDVYDAVYAFIEKKVREKEIDFVELSFFGGEPLLAYSLIIELLEKTKRLCDKFHVSFRASMTTNGFLLSLSRFRRLVEYGCVHYQITVDGVAETHDKVRYLKGKKKTWNRIMSNLKDAVSTEYDFSIVLRTNYNEEIFNVMDELYRYVEEELNDRRIGIYFESIKDHGNEDCPETIGQIEAIAYNEEIMGSIKKHKLQSVSVLKRTSPCSWMCYASKPNFYIVDYDASVKKCSHQLDEEFNTVGQLESDGTMLIDEYRHAKWIYQDYLSGTGCEGCLIKPLCMGKRCPRQSILNGVHCANTIDETDIKLEISSYV